MSAFRDETTPCPRCAGDEAPLEPAGTRLVCGRCGGVFVTTHELSHLLAEMAESYRVATEPDPRPDDRGGGLLPPPVPSALMPGTLPCPRCRIAMQRQILGDEEVDVCPEHGAWFDARELSRALARMGGVMVRRSKLRRFLDKWFGKKGDLDIPDDL